MIELPCNCDNCRASRGEVVEKTKPQYTPSEPITIRVDKSVINANPRKMTATFSLDNPMNDVEKKVVKKVLNKLIKEIISELHPNMFQRIFNLLERCL